MNKQIGKSRTLTIDEIAFLYTVAMGALLHSVKIPEVVASFLVLPSLLIVPCLFGKTILTMLRFLSGVRMFKSLSKAFVNIGVSDAVSAYTISWMLGSYLMATALLVLTLLHLPTIVESFPTLVLILIVFNLTYERYKGCQNHICRQLEAQLNNVKFYSYLIVAMLIAFIGIGITKMFFPFPSIVGRCYFLLPWQVQGAYRIVENGYFAGVRFPDPLFTALSFSLFNVEPLNLLWSASFILAATYTLGIFLLSYRISKSLEIALLSGLFGVFILSAGPIRPSFFITLNSNAIMRAIFPFALYAIYEKMVTDKYRPENVTKTIVLLGLSLICIFFTVRKVYLLNWTTEGTLFFESATLPIFMIVIPLMGVSLSFLLRDKSTRGLFVLVFLCSTIFFFMHMDEGLIYTSVMVFFIIIYKLVKGRFGRPLILVLALATFVFVGLQWLNVWNIYSTNLISSFWSPETKLIRPIDVFDIKRADLESGYGDIILYLAILGCVFALTSKKKEDKMMTGMFLLTTSVFFLPEYQAIRVSSQVFPFMAYVLAVAFYSIHRMIVSFNEIKRSSLNKVVSALITVIMLAAIIPPLIAPVYEISFRLSSPKDPFSYNSIAEYEYEAADWIKRNLSETTILMSDYRTTLIMNSLGVKIWLFGKGMSGTTAGLKTRQALEIIKFKVFEANSSKEASQCIVNELPSYMDAKEIAYVEYAGMKQENITFAIVLSSRTVKWIEKEGIDDIVHAQYFEVPSKYLKLFSDTEYFELIYQIDCYLYVYKVKSVVP